jgi:putative transposase
MPKYRKKKLFHDLRTEWGRGVRDLAQQNECALLEGHLLPDHVRMLIAIPPKYSVAQGGGFLKGKSAISLARTCGRQRNFTGQPFWARGDVVSTVGRDEQVIRADIQAQEAEEQRLDQRQLVQQ